VLLRLEALRAAGKSGFDIAIFQSETISAKPAYPKRKGEHQPSELDVDVWVNKELIHSVLPSVEQVLEQVLAILDGRCK
jgi:outer membrane usher protein FimD/PapC